MRLTKIRVTVGVNRIGADTPIGALHRDEDVKAALLNWKELDPFGSKRRAIILVQGRIGIGVSAIYCFDLA